MVAEGERSCVIMQASVHLEEEKAIKKRIPGNASGAVQCHMCWLRSFGDAPVLQTKAVAPTPSLQAKLVNAKAARQPGHRGGYVVRLKAPLCFQECTWPQWNQMVADPGAHARHWCHSVLLGCAKQLGDTWSCQMQGTDLGGLLGVRKLDVAMALIKLSGALDPTEQTQRWFVQGVSDDTVEKHEVVWLDWIEGETWAQYAARVRRQDSLGTCYGKHQLGLRVRPGDSRIVRKPALWTLDKVPDACEPDDVLTILSEMDFHQVTLEEYEWSRGGTVWKFRARRDDTLTLVSASFQTEEGDVELHAIKAAARQKTHSRTWQLNREQRVSFGAWNDGNPTDIPKGAAPKATVKRPKPHQDDRDTETAHETVDDEGDAELLDDSTRPKSLEERCNSSRNKSHRRQHQHGRGCHGLAVESAMTAKETVYYMRWPAPSRYFCPAPTATMRGSSDSSLHRL